MIFPLAWGATLYRPTGVIAPRAKPSAPRAEPSAPRAEARGGTVHWCSRLGFARRTVYERSRSVHPERSQGVGPYTGVLVSASLDEQFMSGVDVCTLISIPLNRGFSDMNELSKVLRVIYRIS